MSNWFNKFKGKKVLITNNKHPHFNEIGYIESFEVNPFITPSVSMPMYMLKIKGEYNSFFVFEITDFKII